jgi:hypothetical protein
MKPPCFFSPQIFFLLNYFITREFSINSTTMAEKGGGGFVCLILLPFIRKEQFRTCILIQVICPECGKKVGYLEEHMRSVHKKVIHAEISP